MNDINEEEVYEDCETYDEIENPSNVDNLQPSTNQQARIDFSSVFMVSCAPLDLLLGKKEI